MALSRPPGAVRNRHLDDTRAELAGQVRQKAVHPFEIERQRARDWSSHCAQAAPRVPRGVAEDQPSGESPHPGRRSSHGPVRAPDPGALDEVGFSPAEEIEHRRKIGRVVLEVRVHRRHDVGAGRENSGPERR
jgi:hypothetical protein